MPTIPNVPFHVQNTGRFCGPASAMMVASTVDASHLADAQVDYFATTNVSPQGADSHIVWDSFPDGLTLLLRNLIADNRVVLFRLHNEPEMTRLLCDAVLIAEADPSRQVPPIVLVRGFAHWLVVVGFRARGNLVSGFVVHDPAPVTPFDDPTRRHDLATDHCVRGAGIGPGTPFHVINARQWRTLQMTGIYKPSRWNPITATPPCGERCGNFLAIARDTAEAADGDFERPLPLDTGDWVLQPDSAAIYQGRLDAAVAQGLANLNDFPYDEEDPFAAGFRDPQASLAPVLPLVDAESGDVASIILPFNVDDETRFAARVDANSGDLLEMWVQPNGTLLPPDIRSRERIIDRSEFALGGATDEMVRVVPYVVTDRPPAIVWEPSHESPSALLPYFATTEVDTGQPIYVRLDGIAFRELTPTQA